jgi:hypothetical protein
VPTLEQDIHLYTEQNSALTVDTLELFESAEKQFFVLPNGIHLRMRHVTVGGQFDDSKPDMGIERLQMDDGDITVGSLLKDNITALALTSGNDIYHFAIGGMQDLNSLEKWLRVTLIFLEFVLFFIASMWMISGCFMIFSFFRMGDPHLIQIPIVLVPAIVLCLIGFFLRKIRKSILNNFAEE